METTWLATTREKRQSSPPPSPPPSLAQVECVSSWTLMLDLCLSIRSGLMVICTTSTPSLPALLSLCFQGLDCGLVPLCHWSSLTYKALWWTDQNPGFSNEFACSLYNCPFLW